MAVVQVENPGLAFAAVVKEFGPPPLPAKYGIHPTAIISPKAELDPDHVYIGPYSVIDDEVRLGKGCMIHSHVTIGFGTHLGDNCIIYPGAIIKHRCILGNRVMIHSNSVVGTDGFGYELKDGHHVKIEQVGIVQIDDDVEVGSCTTIDRARFGRTHIGEGTKIDNLVQIAHNVSVGKHCILCSMVGVSGSTKIGDYVTMAGQVGVAGHVDIGDHVIFMAKSGVTKDIKEPGMYTGYPAKPIMEGRRMLTYPARVPEILERIKVLEKRLAELEKGHLSPSAE